MKSFKRPNILLIYTDQQRWDSLQCYGNNLAITPNLDRLAKSGALMNKNFIQNPVCTPSRISMLTGRYCSSTNIGNNGHKLEKTLTPVNQLLKPYGYHTAQIGKLHFNPHAKRDHKDPTPTYGFDTFILSDEPGCYDDAYTKWVENMNPDMVQKIRTSLAPAAQFYNQPEYSLTPRNTHEPYVFEAEEDYSHSSFVTSETCNYIKKHKDDLFFVIAGFYAPHTPVNPPQRFIDMYNPKDMPLPKVGKNEEIPDYLKDIDESKWQEIISYYMALVSHVDDCVGQIIKTLEDENLIDSTIIVFTSDHGEYLGDHGMIQKGMPGHDCISRVPLLISYPPLIKANKKVLSLTESVDIVPTILDYCGVQIPTFVQGKSLRDVISGKNNNHKDNILIEYFDPNGSRQSTIRNDNFKYYCNTDGDEILYDLNRDPYELNNIIENNKYKEILSSLRKQMIIKIQKAAFNGYESTAPY